MQQLRMFTGLIAPPQMLNTKFHLLFKLFPKIFGFSGGTSLWAGNTNCHSQNIVSVRHQAMHVLFE